MGMFYSTPVYFHLLSVGEAMDSLPIDITNSTMIERCTSLAGGFFSNAMINSHEGKRTLTQAWHQILRTLGESQSQTPISTSLLTAAATSLSFGLDRADELLLTPEFCCVFENCT